MSTTWLPGARIRDLSGFVTNGPFTSLYGVCLHVNVDEYGTPIGFWGPGNPSSVVPNFQVYKDGSVDQMLPFNRQPWCQVDGNFNYAAIESAGMPNEPYTSAQLATIARILAIYHAEYGVPLQVADSPGQRGLIVHSAGGQAWGGHSCPGTVRAGQRPQILALAGGTPTPTTDWFDMATEAELRAIIQQELAAGITHARTTDLIGDAKGGGHLLETFLGGIPGYKSLAARAAKAVVEPDAAPDDTEAGA